jgi:PAS domain S-box-containing protein
MQPDKWMIVGLLAGLLVETLLVALLLWLWARRRKTDERLAQRLRLQRLTAQLAASFVGLPPQLVKAEVERAFQLLMENLDLDRISLFELSPGGTRLQLLCSRATAGVQPAPAEMQAKQFPWVMGKLLHEKPILVSKPEQLPPEAPALKAALLEQGVRSFANLPLKANGVLFGALSFCRVRGECDWPPERVQDLQMVADIFGSALKRKSAEEELRESERRFRLMADSAPVLMWMAGLDKGCTDFNRAWLDFTGRTLEQELGHGWAEGVHPDDLQRCLSQYAAAFDACQSFTLEYRLRRHDGQYRWVLDRGVPRFLGDGSFAGYIGCCTDISEQKEAEAARQELSDRLIAAQEEERARIARELHDDINQRLALLANGFRQLGRPQPAARGFRQKQELQRLLQLTNEISSDVQNLSHQLHPSTLEYLGLAAAVRDLCQEVARQHALEVDCRVHEVPAELDDRVSLSLFRTAQEALRNVAKHSHAQHAKVELTGGSGVVRLTVSDDGVGFDPEQGKSRYGLGLVSMEERLRSVGGEVSIRSKPSQGTQVEATAPATLRPAWRARRAS